MTQALIKFLGVYVPRIALHAACLDPHTADACSSGQMPREIVKFADDSKFASIEVLYPQLSSRPAYTDFVSQLDGLLFIL
jgi:hypothetical protein